MSKPAKIKPEITEIAIKIAEWLALLFDAKVTIIIENGVKKHTFESDATNT